MLDFLKVEGLIDRVKIVDTEKYPFEALQRGVLSTPSIFIDGKLKYAGKVDLQEFKEILKGDVKGNNKASDPVEELMIGVVNSFAVTAWLYLHRNFEALLDQREFVQAVSGVGDDQRLYDELIERVRSKGEELLKKWEERMLRNIASNFVRELFWLYGRKLSWAEIESKYPLEVFAHWLMLRGGAVGRVGLSIIPLSNREALSRIRMAYNYLNSHCDELWDKVMKEQWELMGTVHV